MVKYLNKQLFMTQMPEKGVSNINIKDVLYIIFKRWWIILFCMILGALAAYGYTMYSYIPSYTVTTSLLVSSSNRTSSPVPTSVSSGISDITLAQKLVDTYAAVLKSNRVLEAAAKDTGENITAATIASNINITTDDNAGLIYLTVSYKDPAVAIKISNSITKVAPAIIDELVSIGTIKVLDAASNSVHTVAPEKLKNSILGALVGLVFGVVLLVIRILLKPTVLRIDDIKYKTGISVLGSIPHVKKSKWRGKEKVPQINKPKITSNFYESIKALRTNILYMCEQKNHHVLLISGATENEGKTTTAINLALSLASQYKVLLIDADLHKPSIAKELHTDKSNNVSLKFLLDYPDRYMNYVEIEPNSGLGVLTFKKTNGASDFLNVAQLKNLINKMRDDYDYIIIDSSPSQYNADATIISQAVDSVVLVIRQNHTPVDVIVQSQTDFIMVQVEILGSILSDARYIRFDSAGKYRYYQSRYYNRDK